MKRHPPYRYLPERSECLESFGHASSESVSEASRHCRQDRQGVVHDYTDEMS